MRLGIDASSIRAGGGVTHLTELLRAAQPEKYGFDEVVVWAGERTLGQLEPRPWLRGAHQPLLDRGLSARIYWQQFMLAGTAHRERCSLLFVPGGSYRGSFRPYVTMCRNMLPFEWHEARRYGISWLTLKLLVLRQSQLATFRNADGLIFLSDYARGVLTKLIDNLVGRSTTIPHGVDDRFRARPRVSRTLSSYTSESPLRLLYVSAVAPYKHQIEVARAVLELRQEGVPLVLDLVGSKHPGAKRFFQMLSRDEELQQSVCYLGVIPFHEIRAVYHVADVFVYASSCENLPNILLEAMAAGLPIACSERGPMPEVLGDGGVYFDPERSMEIAQALRALIHDPALREKKAWKAYDRARSFSWQRCSSETFAFLSQVAEGGRTAAEP